MKFHGFLKTFSIKKGWNANRPAAAPIYGAIEKSPSDFKSVYFHKLSFI
jgi:hypothetical protein